jgi:hypothetical protein
MLGKLLKYEFKATGRTFLPMYALLIVMALVTKFFNSSNLDYYNTPRIISVIVFVVVIVAVSVMTLVIAIQRFNKNLLSDEGYLSFTLPVKAHSHIDAKMIVSFVWTVLSVLISILAILVSFADRNMLDQFGRFFGALPDAVREIGGGFYVVLLECIVLAVVSVLGGIVEIYAAVTIGNLSSKHRLLVGVGAYIGFWIVQQIISTTIMNGFGLTQYFASLRLASTAAVVGAAESALLGLIIYCLIFGVLFYFLTEWLLRKKLNLE